MKRTCTKHRFSSFLSCAASLLLAPVLLAQDASSRADERAGDLHTDRRRLSAGVRLRGFPLDVLGDGVLARSTGTPVADWIFTTTSTSPKLGYGLSLEYVLGRRWSLMGEAMFHRIAYRKLTEAYQGTDNVFLTTITENTKARLWDVPIMVRYHGVAHRGFLAHIFVAGGGVWRRTSRVRTTNDFVFPDGTTASNNSPASLSKRSLPGVNAGLGFRFVDDVNIKVTPEVRYTRWVGSSFSNESTRSPRNQLEVGVALTF